MGTVKYWYTCVSAWPNRSRHDGSSCKTTRWPCCTLETGSNHQHAEPLSKGWLEQVVLETQEVPPRRLSYYRHLKWNILFRSLFRGPWIVDFFVLIWSEMGGVSGSTDQCFILWGKKSRLAGTLGPTSHGRGEDDDDDLVTLAATPFGSLNRILTFVNSTQDLTSQHLDSRHMTQSTWPFFKTSLDDGCVLFYPFLIFARLTVS